MTKFTVQKEHFVTFLKTCAMEGAIKFRDKKKVTSPLFSCFYLEAIKKKTVTKEIEGKKIETLIPEQLKVLSFDTYRKSIKQKTTLRNVKVEEEGRILIADYRVLVGVIGGKGIKANAQVTIWNEDTDIFVETEGSKDAYEIRQKTNKDFKLISGEGKKSKTLIQELDEWNNNHKWEDNILIFYAYHPKTKKLLGSAEFNTVLKLKKEDIMSVVSDAIDLTKDNKTRVILSDDEMRMFKGEANSEIKSKHLIDFENIGSEIETFDEEFYSIQTIIPNMFNEIFFHLRRVNANNSIAIWIKSSDLKNGIEINIGLVSIISKDKSDEEDE